jgi:hypothetical protein
VNAFYRAVFNYLQLFDVWLPFAVGPPGNLAASDADSVACLNGFIADIAFCHITPP